jgi:hypothetical protein
VSLVVKLEDDLGERSDWVILHGVISSREERDFPLLRGIDLYGKTVFHHLQMEESGRECAIGRPMNLRKRPGRKLERWPRLARRIAIST